MINVAIDAARQAGQLAYSYFGKVKNVRYKGDSSLAIAINTENISK